MQNMQKVAIKTRDGSCPTYLFRPSGEGPWPAVLMFMDGVGIRPAMFEIAARIASHGYFVALPDYFYRAGEYEPMKPAEVLGDPAKRKHLYDTYFATATPANVMSDASAVLDFLAAQPDVRPGGIGTTGYCLGGLMSLTAAGTFGGRVAASASFHGGKLATDAPDSPHLLSTRIRARLYIAGAIEDASFTDEMRDRLAFSLSVAGVDYAIETYPARHGWVPSDTPTHDPAAAERHWQALFALFDVKLAKR